MGMVKFCVSDILYIIIISYMLYDIPLAKMCAVENLSICCLSFWSWSHLFFVLFLHNFFLLSFFLSLSLCPLFTHPMNQQIYIYVFKHVQRALNVINVMQNETFRLFFFHFVQKRKKNTVTKSCVFFYLS